MSYDERYIIRQLTKVSRALDEVKPWSPEWLRYRAQERKLRFLLQHLEYTGGYQEYPMYPK